MKKFFIILLAIFLFSCSQNSENISQKNSENTTKSEKNFQNIDNNSYYIGANILNAKDLKISKILAGSKWHGQVDKFDENSPFQISYFFGAESNHNENIEFFTNTQNKGNIEGIISIFSTKNWQEYIRKNITRTENSNMITYNLQKLTTEELLEKHNESFEISHIDTGWTGNNQDKMIIDIWTLQPFFTDNIIINIAVPSETQKITYTTIDGNIHNYSMETMLNNHKYIETESNCGIDAPWCTLIFNADEAKNISKIQLEWNIPAK